MVGKVQVYSIVGDARALVKQKSLSCSSVFIADCYYIDADLTAEELAKIAGMLCNPVSQKTVFDREWTPEEFDWAVEIGFLPGVTDNVGNTARESVEDLLKKRIEGVYYSQVVFAKGGSENELSLEKITAWAQTQYNPLIQRAAVKSRVDFERDGGMGLTIPKVRLATASVVDEIRILNAPDSELEKIGREGIKNADGSSRGPLALDLEYMKAIQSHFEKLGRNPTDIEMEMLAQTWSEHCKHTIFRDSMDEVEQGLFKAFIKGATDEIRKRKGEKDFCVSVFKDNSGAIEFDEDYLVTDKVETHNSPSALDPFGGAETGIVGVNRDTIGFGLAAKPVINKYFYCFGKPDDAKKLYRNAEKTREMLSPRQILNGVVAGVNAGGNQSGIPTPQGGLYFHDSYKGKPLVFCGTVGLIPKTIAGRSAHEGKAEKGDLIVMTGGRVGKDGIHGATFSSEALNTGSPATAVQIGDPITQKKMSDAIVKEARDRGLYNAITDDGAGGLSSSVGEMALQTGGCIVFLNKVPLKYAHLAPWEIWISESQERMTLAVPKEKWEEFKSLMESRGVEATAIGEFNDSGKCTVEFAGSKAVELDLEFLHEGLPKRVIATSYSPPKREEPIFEEPQDLGASVLQMLSRLNVAGFEFISMQYDHEVQGGSVLKPLQGKGRVNGEASVTRPRLDSHKAIVLSQGIEPSYGLIDTYHMAANAIDAAVRNAVCTGANPEKIALLDNFCWCSSNEPQRLGELKRAVKACYDYAVAYQTPFISGKDSMYNDFKGFDENGKPVKISVLPTLLISAIGVMEDSRKAVSLDAKKSGDAVYVIGETFDELGASEYYAMAGEKNAKEFVGESVPKVNAQKNLVAYKKLAESIEDGLIASAQGIGRGGLAIALAKTSVAGMLGMDIDLNALPGKTKRNDFALFSESAGRIVVTVAPENCVAFEEKMQGIACAKIGAVADNDVFSVRAAGKQILSLGVKEMFGAYKKTFEGF